jgi:hypothetical protein
MHTGLDLVVEPTKRSNFAAAKVRNKQRPQAADHAVSVDSSKLGQMAGTLNAPLTATQKTNETTNGKAQNEALISTPSHTFRPFRHLRMAPKWR